MGYHDPNLYTPPDCWVLLRWTDHGAVSVLGVYPTYEYALLGKGDSLDPRLNIVKAPLYELALSTADDAATR